MEVGARSKRICAPATAAAVTVPSPCQRREGMTGSSGRGVTFLADASRKLRCRRRQGLRGKRKSHTSFASSLPEDQVVGPCRRCLSLSPCARVSSGHEPWGRAGTFTATGSIMIHFKEAFITQCSWGFFSPFFSPMMFLLFRTDLTQDQVFW